jgi:hypothetical protein
MEGKQLSLRLDCLGNDVIGTVLFHTFCFYAEELLLDNKGVVDPDPHHLWRLDPEAHQSGKLDPY